MSKLPAWTIALILSLSGVSVFGLLCLTVIQFQEGNLRIRFEAPGGIKLDAGVEKGLSQGNREKRLLLENKQEQAEIAE